MTLKENMEKIKFAIEALECPLALSFRGVCLSYEEALRDILEIPDIPPELEEAFNEYLIYYDRLKEEEEGEKRGRYTEKRAGFKV